MTSVENIVMLVQRIGMMGFKCIKGRDEREEKRSEVTTIYCL